MMSSSAAEQQSMARYQQRKRWLSRAFSVLCFLAMITCLLILLFLLASVAYRGTQYLSWDFITNLISRKPEKAGIWVYLVGSVWLIALTTMFAVPIGVGSALYLEEYAADSRWKRLVQLNIANLAGVPSIVYGLLGLGIFVWRSTWGVACSPGRSRSRWLSCRSSSWPRKRLCVRCLARFAKPRLR